MSKKPDAQQKSAILDARDRLVAMNPNFRVIGAHSGSMETHLENSANASIAIQTSQSILYRV